ncbi:hypothetical protein Syun_021883 [Stephania yunnanensis]|uniref:Uncharacterized protein n=1 Tax=Stephania yunnanensis TaxID=152371 RepID=A0AAP0IGG8_9MAGN
MKRRTKQLNEELDPRNEMASKSNCEWWEIDVINAKSSFTIDRRDSSSSNEPDNANE